MISWNKKEEEYKKQLKDYYDSKSSIYRAAYTGKNLYRSAYFRMQTTMHLLQNINPIPKTILDAGCGDGRVLLETIKSGFNCVGFDNSKNMLNEAKRYLEQNGYKSDAVRYGDIYDIPFEKDMFDLVLCLGVLPNLPNHKSIFEQFRKVLKKDGSLIASFNNELFSLFSINKYTVTFFEELYNEIRLQKGIKDDVLLSLKEWLHLEDISIVKKVMEDSEIDKKDVCFTRYNPLNVYDIFREYGFQVEEIRFCHYHPIPPCFEKKYPILFKEFAEKLETVEYDWRGGILCNMMLVQARII